MKKKAKSKRLVLPTSAAELKWHNVDDLLAEVLKDKKVRDAYQKEQGRRALARQIRESRVAKKLTQQSVAKVVRGEPSDTTMFIEL